MALITSERAGVDVIKIQRILGTFNSLNTHLTGSLTIEWKTRPTDQLGQLSILMHERTYRWITCSTRYSDPVDFSGPTQTGEARVVKEDVV